MKALTCLFVIAPGLAAPALAQTCEPTPQTHAVRITAPETQSAPVSEFPEVYGDHDFYQRLDNGWVFALRRAETGWTLGLYEKEPIGDSVDLTSLTPPLYGPANPRNLFGWHFRNEENTAPNAGEVNAPQEMRAFVISPALQGTGGLRHSGGEIEPGPGDGIGWLKVIDFGLANPVPGTQARMNYLKFDACLSWPRDEAEADKLRDRASLDYTETDRETFGSCGLDLQTFELEAAYAPRTLGGDLDGDGAIDEAAQIRRASDDTHGIALCRAGTWIDTLGFATPAVGEVREGYFGEVEAWQWITPGEELPRYMTGYDLPEADGDILVLERVEKEAVLVYWAENALQMKRLYHHVEP